MLTKIPSKYQRKFRQNIGEIFVADSITEVSKPQIEVVEMTT